MLITNVDDASNFRRAFENNLCDSKSVKIASGYIGGSELDKYQKAFCKIAENGGTVQLIHGMGGAEGIKPNLYARLIDLDSQLKETNNNNRIFVHKTHYHGKLYITDGAKKRVLLGSSNFSNSGFGRNLELNFNHTDHAMHSEAEAFFSHLKDNSYPITNFILPSPKSAEHKVRRYSKYDAEIFNRKPDNKVTIGVTERSNLNLFLSKGRLNSITGIYSPRSFFEVELTLKARDLPDLRPYLPDQLQPAVFRAVTDLNSTFEVKFKRKSSNRDDNRTLHETGIDFMSSPRNELGHYIKGKLMREGLLNFGEPITEDVLLEYGKNTLDFYFADDSLVYLRF